MNSWRNRASITLSLAIRYGKFGACTFAPIIWGMVWRWEHWAPSFGLFLTQNSCSLCVILRVHNGKENSSQSYVFFGEIPSHRTISFQSHAGLVDDDDDDDFGKFLSPCRVQFPNALKVWWKTCFRAPKCDVYLIAFLSWILTSSVFSSNWLLWFNSLLNAAGCWNKICVLFWMLEDETKGMLGVQGIFQVSSSRFD